MAAAGGEEAAEGRIRRSLQKLDLPDWYKRSSAGSREKLLLSGSNSPSPSGRPRWSEWRQRSTSASSLGPLATTGGGGDWSANSSFKRFSGTTSGRQSKESLQLQSPMSPSSVSGMPSAWYGGGGGGSSGGQRPHSAFNCYSYHHAGYSSASVSRCSSSRSTSPSALAGPPPLLRSPYRQPYLGWRSSEKLAREHSGVGNPSSTTTTSTHSYHYRSPAERLSKGPGYYAFKFGMYAQTTAQGGSYVRQMVQEIERANHQQQQQQQQTTTSGSHQGRSQVTVNVIGPSPSELQPEVVDQVEDMVREIDKLIVQNGGDDEEEGEKAEAAETEVEEEEEEKEVSEIMTGSGSFKPCLWMESSFVGTKPTSDSRAEDAAAETSGETSIDVPVTSAFNVEEISGSSEKNTSGTTINLDFPVISGFTDEVLAVTSGTSKSDISGFTNKDEFQVSDASGSVDYGAPPAEVDDDDVLSVSGFANVSSGLVTSADVHDTSGFLDDLPDPVFDDAPSETEAVDGFRVKDVIKATAEEEEEEYFRSDDVSMNHSSTTNEHAQPITTTTTIQALEQNVPEANERKFSLSTVELDDVLDSLLALPSTSSNRISPCSRYLPPPPAEPALPVVVWPTAVQAHLQVPSAPPLEPEEEETEADEEEEEEGASDGSSTCGSSTGSGSPSGCSSVSSVSRTAACTSATSASTSSSTSCSHPSCNRDSSSTATDRPEETSERPETNTGTSTTTHSHTLSTTHSTDESTLNNEEPLSEGSSFPPPPGASELQQMMCLYEEGAGGSSNAPGEQQDLVIQADEQPLCGQPQQQVGRTRRYPRPDYLDNLSLVRCSRGGCEREMELKEARNQFKTCHNCYTFYCSRECRKEHWELHRTSCMYGRVRSLCKQALQYSRENEVVLHGLTKIARTGLLTQGPGFVKLLFRNTDTAIRYLREGRPQLEDGPIYVGWRNFLPEEMGDDVYRVVVQLCQNYDPANKFILVVAVFVTREVPLRTVPHWEREIIAKCAKISLAKNGGGGGDLEYLNNTLVLSGPPDMSYLGLSERESRLACLDNISQRLEEHGVNLKLSYPDVYHRLTAYVDLDEPFTPITIYPKDTHTGNTFMCVIMPNTNSHHPPLPPTSTSTTTTTQPIN